MAEVATEGRWKDVDRLLSRHGNLVAAEFDPRPDVCQLSFPFLLRSPLSPH